MNPRQTGAGVPGSFPLPNPGNVGTTYTANRMHPAAAAGLSMAPRQNPVNGGRPATPGGKR